MWISLRLRATATALMWSVAQRPAAVVIEVIHSMCLHSLLTSSHWPDHRRTLPITLGQHPLLCVIGMWRVCYGTIASRIESHEHMHLYG
uniref:Secreted protein n=1 Tax=Arundo donax TaxID=35708 RepID=A0A0A9FRZ0_ARUDO